MEEHVIDILTSAEEKLGYISQMLDKQDPERSVDIKNRYQLRQIDSIHQDVLKAMQQLEKLDVC